MLDYLGLPRISSLRDLSAEINLSEYTLFLMSRNTDLYYKEVAVPKKNGGTRLLACPSSEIKAIQAWILRNILEKISVSRYATAFKKDVNVLHNARIHIGNLYVLCMDIEDFFGSIKANKVYSFFIKLGYSRQAALLFTKFCTYKGCLPQGGVTSPALSNILNRDLDTKISNVCKSLNVFYTRYADDLTFSSNNLKKLREIRNNIEEILNSEGYRVNTKKTRLRWPGTRREITGLIYSDNNSEVRIGKRTKKILRAKIHHLESGLEKNEDRYYKLFYHLVGWMSYLHSVDLKTYNQLLRYWNSLNSNNAFVAVSRSFD